MTTPVLGRGAASARRGLIEASEPDRRRLQAFLAQAAHELARSTARGAASLGAMSVLPQSPEVLVAGWSTDERGE